MYRVAAVELVSVIRLRIPRIRGIVVILRRKHDVRSASRIPYFALCAVLQQPVDLMEGARAVTQCPNVRVLQCHVRLQRLRPL